MKTTHVTFAFHNTGYNNPDCITKTYPCTIQRFVSVVNIQNKLINNLYSFHISNEYPLVIYVLDQNLRQIVYPFTSQPYYIRIGGYGVVLFMEMFC